MTYEGLWDQLRSVAQQATDRPALSYYSASLTYGDLLEKIEEVCQSFVAWGIRRGDIVTLALPTTPESIACVYALNRIGAIPSLIDVRFPPEKVARLVNQTQSKLLFVMGFNSVGIASVANEIGADRIIVLSGRESLPKVVSLGTYLGDLFNGRAAAVRSGKKMIRWGEFLSKGSNPREIKDYRWQAAEAALIFQTSGTTGETKSVQLTTDNCKAAFNCTVATLDSIEEQDTVLCLLPLFVFYGLMSSVHLPLSMRIHIKILPFFRLPQFLKILAKYKPNIVFSVPSHWATIYDARNERLDLSCLKNLFLAGDIMLPSFEKDINQFLRRHGSQCTLVKAYGMTETAGPVAIAKGDDEKKYTLGFSGKIVPPYRASIVDGEICVLAEGRFLGYYQNGKATAELIKTHEDGLSWLHTGDTGYFDESGNLYVTGRKKRMIVRLDGSKLFPVEVEALISKCEYVSQCAVIATKNSACPMEQDIAAFIIPSEEGKKLPDEKLLHKLSAYCSSTLPPYMRPTRCVLCTSFPLTPSGKIAYEQLTCHSDQR